MPEQPNREVDVFNAALELRTHSERAAYLDKACGGDAALRQRVEALLQAHEQAGTFLETSPATLALISAPITEKAGDRIGRYKLLQQIGEGGCGVVYMAEQEEPVRRRVALKIIKLGMDTKQVIARFEAERQALAMMDHPNIAKVLDAGATETGRPFFVMELVRGVPITVYCDENNLPMRERLELFIQVCQAVQHAHQKGIIHRDLKPSNILVTVNDGVAVPKVIDFGIAKATTGQQLTDKTLFTAFEQFIGTPAYMSPEQAVMTSLDVDTRSDIYSLGVLLYELLTAKTPFDPKELLQAGFDEMRRTVREQEPARPSTRLSTMLEGELTTTAKHRHTEPPKLIHLIRGDLDWIVMKCLEKDRTRRYETANGLAMDIQRHLNNEPIVARPPSKLYEFRKTVQRHKFGFAACASIIIVLAAGVIVSTTEAIRATRAEREQARLRQMTETKEKKSEQTAQFLKDMLAAAGPSVARGRDATVLREILGKASDRVGRELKTQPEVAGDLWFTIGNTYADIGDYARAVTNFQQAVESYRAAFGGANPRLAAALGRLGSCRSFTGDIPTGKSDAQSGLEMARKCGDPGTLALCLMNMAGSLNLYGLCASEGEPFWREAVSVRKKLGNDPVALADCLHGLACSMGNDSDGAESLEREAIALYRQHLGTDYPKFAKGLLLLGQKLLDRGKVDEAETVMRESYNLYGKLYDKNHPYHIVVTRFFAQALVLGGKDSEADSIVRRDLEVFPSHSEYLNLLGAVSACRRDWPEAAARFSNALEANPGDWDAALHLVVAFLEAGQIDEYREHCHEFLKCTGDWRVVRGSLLLPVEGDDFERACQVADGIAAKTWAAQPEPQVGLIVALAELRRSRFASAYDWANRIIEADKDKFSSAAYFIQAMASARLHKMETGRAALAKGDGLLGQPFRQDLLWNWAEWTIAEYLGREAKALLEDQHAAESTRLD